MSKRKILTLAEVKTKYPDAIANLEADGEDLLEISFTIDRKGRLHIDDATHPSYDDVWNGDSWETG